MFFPVTNFSFFDLWFTPGEAMGLLSSLAAMPQTWMLGSLYAADWAQRQAYMAKEALGYTTQAALPIKK